MSEYPAVADQQAGNRQWLAKLVARAGSSHAP
jgi:hypothetical protein